MIFGMPTLVELSSIEENVRLCTELGLSFVELSMNLPYCQLEAISPEGLGAIARQHGLFFTLHLEENLDPASFNPLVAQAYVETAARSIRLARAAGIPIVNTHLNRGVYFTLPSERLYLYERYPEHYRQAMDRFRRAWREGEAHGRPMLLVENTEGFVPFQQTLLEGWLQEDAFGLTLDIGHAHAAGYPDAEFYRDHGDRLRHIHLHDARGSANHLSLGEGDVDLPAILRLAREKNCSVVVEVKTASALADSVEWLRSNGWMGE